MPPDILKDRRPLGKTNFPASRLGIGDLADRSLPLDQCVATARRALDAGLNLIDTAPSYEDGYSEQIVGQALRQSRLRDQTFLITKIDHFDQPVEPQVDASLDRLGLDHADAFVFHGVSTLEHWNTIHSTLAPRLAALKNQKLRFLGISSHHPDVLLQALHSEWCDLLMFAVGPYVHPRYISEILPLAKKQNLATVAFKTFGAGKLLGDTQGYSRPLANRPRGKLSSGGEDAAAPLLPRLSVEECLHYTLTCDPSVALLGMSFANEQDAAFAAARSFTAPLPEPHMQKIRERAQDAIQNKGPCWWNPP